jgi:putative acetyltransferase
VRLPAGRFIGTAEVQIVIRRDDLNSGEVRALVTAHRQFGFSHSPPGSAHALDVESLVHPEMTFWTAWADTVLVGCGALKELSKRHGEIKTMHTVSQFRRRRIGARMLTHSIDEAKRRGYQRLSLETGSASAFEPARVFYARFGFKEYDPFGDYREDPHSVFMMLALDSGAMA